MERNFKPDLVQPRTETQAELLEALEESTTIAAVGPAGTGKTYLAASWAVEKLQAKDYQQVVLARPVLGVGGKTLGFLPGDLNRKLGPWFKATLKILKERLSGKQFEELRNSGALVLCSFEHIRGETYDNAVMIIDEAQSTTVDEMKVFLTRTGENTKVIICGDLDQNDLPNGVTSGLAVAQAIIDKGLVPEAETVEFGPEDVVRSATCRAWAEAFKSEGF